MKTFHITIKRNDTGEIIKDLDSDAIIGSIENEEGTAIVAMTNCETKQMIASILTARKAADVVLKEIEADAPKGFADFINLLAKLGDVADKEDSDADTDATEN